MFLFNNTAFVIYSMKSKTGINQIDLIKDVIKYFMQYSHYETYLRVYLTIINLASCRCIIINTRLYTYIIKVKAIRVQGYSIF